VRTFLSSGENFWVSATDRDGNPGEFSWTDYQTPVDKDSWEPGYPKEFGEGLYTSVVLNAGSFRLRDQKYNKNSFFLCELERDLVNCL
jgi:hypothetical protein